MNIKTATHSGLRHWRWAVAAGLAVSALGAHAGGVQWSVGVGSPGVAVQVRGGQGGYGAYGGRGAHYGGRHGYYPQRYYRSYGYRGGYGWRGPGWSVWGPATAIGIGLPLIYEATREPVYVAPVAAPIAAPVAPPPSRPDPVVYPRDGQSSQQAEADRRGCDRWATTQPAAMADASVFHRAVEACMDGRGYTIR